MTSNPAPGAAKQPLFPSLSDSQVAQLQQTLLQLIDTVEPRIHYAEQRRTTLIALVGAIVAGSLALVSFAFANVQYLPLRLALLTVALWGIGLTIVVWQVYARQTNWDYPFKTATKVWKWFYRDALPRQDEFAVHWSAKQSEESKKAGREAFERQWPTFQQQQTNGLTDPRESAYQDLQQLYILHVNEAYKNRFLTRLREVVSVGLAGMVFLSLAGALISAGLYAYQQHWVGGDSAPRSAVHKTSTREVRSSWRLTGASRINSMRKVEVQVLLNSVIHNNSRRPLVAKNLKLVDATGLVIPALQEMLEPAVVVRPNSSARMAAVVWVPESLISSLDYVDIGP